jgi:hypothetical protein
VPRLATNLLFSISAATFLPSRRKTRMREAPGSDPREQGRAFDLVQRAVRGDVGGLRASATHLGASAEMPRQPHRLGQRLVDLPARQAGDGTVVGGDRPLARLVGAADGDEVAHFAPDGLPQAALSGAALSRGASVAKSARAGRAAPGGARR